MIMARQGHGVAWLPLTLAEEDLARADLVRAGAEEFDIPIEIRLFRSRDGRNPAADALWNRLTGQRDDTPRSAMADTKSTGPKDAANAPSAAPHQPGR